MANIGNVVNVSILPNGKSLSRTNMNIVSIFTSELGVLSTKRRTIAYTDLNSVANDFGTISTMYEYAKTLFAQPKNPSNSGGYLVAAFWRAVDEVVPATAGVLTGSQITESIVVKTLQSVADGSFDISVDGIVQNITATDFRTINSMADVVAILGAAITGATVTYVNQQIVITSATTGATSSVSLISAGAVGTFVGETLALASGTGAVSTAGSATTTLLAETKEAAVIEAFKNEAFRGAVFIDKPIDTDVTALSLWGKSNDVIFYDVFNNPLNLEKTVTNIVWKTTTSGGNNYRMIYRKDGNRKAAVAEMARMHTINFNNQNSAITMNLKELVGITPEPFTQTEINKCQTVGLDIYVQFGNVPKLLASGANGQTDNVYNFIAIKNFIQIDLFNLLGTTATKLAQIDADVHKIVDTIEQTLSMFKRAKAIAAGTWNSSDTFGDVDVFKRNILDAGYYVYSQPLSQQAQSDRVARKAPAIQVAFKNAGAIHTIDTTIQYNL